MVAVVASTLAVKLVGEILNRKFGVKGRNPPAVVGRRPFGRQAYSRPRGAVPNLGRGWESHCL